MPGPPPPPPLGICANLRAVVMVETGVESTKSGLQGKAPCLKTQAHVKPRLKSQGVLSAPREVICTAVVKSLSCDSQLPPVFGRVSWTCKCLT